MKNFKLLIISFLLFTSSTYAQKYPNEFVLSSGIGYSVFTSSVRLDINSSLRDNGFNTIKSISIPGVFGSSEVPFPLLNFQLDYAVNERFSVGIAYTRIKFNTDQTESINDTLYHAIVSLSKQNFGLRALYHFGSNERLDLYIGGRLGYSIWIGDYAITNNFGDDKAVQLMAKNKPTLQFIFGLRKYVNDFIGVHVEAGLGSPYLLNCGLSFKIG